MIEYVLEKTEDGDIEGCECCQCDVPTHLFDKPMYRQNEPNKQTRLCEVCSATFISLAYQYDHYPTDVKFTLQCMAQCTNMILEAIKKAVESK